MATKTILHVFHPKYTTGCTRGVQ